MLDTRQRLGVRGELVAERWLGLKGFRLLQRRYRSGHRDIDLVVERDGVVVFVEVKTRSGVDFGHPIEAVDWRKQRELVRSANTWIDRNGRPGELYRFDVVGVWQDGDRVRVKHVPDAFRLAGTH